MQGSAEKQQMEQKKSASAQNPETVRKVQEALNDKGYKAGPADGKFGPKSQKALKDYKKAEGMKPTGQIDNQTLAKLGVSSEGAAAGGMQSGQTGSGDQESGETSGK